jgi:hypothetical protein
MLKNIRLHIEQDEEKQNALEEKLAKHIALTQKDNINAFQRQIPSLLPYIQDSRSQNIALICNKFEKFNLVDYGLGRVLYGFNPEDEVRQQVAAFKSHSSYVDFYQHSSDTSITPAGSPDLKGHLFLKSLPAYQQYKQKKSFPEKVELLVVLGLGLGHHIKMLVESSDIKHLIIYEPELQYFSCSVMVVAWSEILQTAKAKGTAIYMQLGKDGRDLLKDMGELREHFNIDGFYLYQHYHNPIFNSLNKELNERSWSTLEEKGIVFSMQEINDEYCPTWTPPITLDSYHSVDRANQKFQNNLKAFEKYFPDIHAEFKDYQPKKWLPIETHDGKINILKMDSLASWYSDKPAEDCISNLKNYAQQPNKDGLALGYNGSKLKHYIHYQFVKESEAILESLEEEEGELPDTIKSLIMFGLGAGYQLEELVNTRKIEKLFLCEPNRDFFFASLFAIDWSLILSTIDQQDGRIYINIGDDGSNLFRDLLNQFYAIGPYILSHTYFYQSYHNASLNQAIGQLREQLQVVISMGEYFDHARYGIAHTKEAFMREYPHMLKGAVNKLSFNDKNLPVFIVGNGPSLDYSIDVIKQWQGQAIIVSCGTSLQVLKKNGITPDFHTEIEQNRTTFDWAARIGDFDYLKSVSLISCNGIHPDTCDLYKDVLIAFKEGESSTVSTLKVVGEDNYETLKFAFPTVTNFALNFFIKLGFSQLYLLGVDLGFADSRKHHSTQSGYYDKEGKQLYDYAEKNNTSLIVPGNFRATVFTKQEFKISKMVMEQSLAAAKVDCYNTSDGARISGSLPLQSNDILLVSNKIQKKACIKHIREKCFTVKTQKSFASEYKQLFSEQTLAKEMSMFRKNLALPISTFEQAEQLIESQKRFLFASYQQSNSLLFYFLYGTVNYANVVLNKVAYSIDDESFSSCKFNQARVLWLKYYDKISLACQKQFSDFDTSTSLTIHRMSSCIKPSLLCKNVLIVSDTKFVAHYPKIISGFLGFDVSIQYVSTSDFISSFDLYKPDFIIFQLESGMTDFFTEINLRIGNSFPTATVLFITNSVLPLSVIKNRRANVHFYLNPCKFPDEFSPPESNLLTPVIWSVLFLADIKRFDFIYPKYTFSKSSKVNDRLLPTDYRLFHFFDLGLVIGASINEQVMQYGLLKNGTRPRLLGNKLNDTCFSRDTVSDDELSTMRKKLMTKHPFLTEERHDV